ncbi:hypothetical protein FB45DRAFT_781417 [Roridomyces roridus]|uniref:Phosphatidate phosphatase APP1 catalytic domain-containing protein n=1 Tax=Roridomyces roridus TaxID=1738132 RepID=A0AAD7CEJ5_9AGAR|nr:hypothetical protein FB45DRAFT_781417 [Roridomyces roridus]
MSKDMPWRPTMTTSSSRFSAVKGYISQRNVPTALQRKVSADGTKQSWKAWAGEKISAGMRGTVGGGSGQGSERVALFPGWATRRYRRDTAGRLQDAFDIELFISGFASTHRAPESASRSQRAFIRLAKGFAALPKLDGSGDGRLSRSTEDLLSSVNLPPRPTEITEEYEVEALERQFQQINAPNNEEDDTASESDESPIVTSNTAVSVPSDVRRLHRNLETRIQPFWSSVISSRTVRLQLFASPLKTDGAPARHNTMEEQDARTHGPVTSRDLVTGVDGSFQARIHVSWEELCQHPGALHIAFGDPLLEHELLVSATLFPASSSNVLQPPASPIETKSLHVTLTYSPIRVISDIDDTVKKSNVLGGAREIFHNVFVKELKDIIIPGMGEWYTRMWKRGVRFHYVSNGPFEILPVLADFFPVAQLPPGSIKLRSYAGRSLFSGLLSAPAARKRAGVQEILLAFPESKFFLIGDSGEQDLELYVELASDHPTQVLGVFIRDVESWEAISDPTGKRATGRSLSGESSKAKWSISRPSSRPSTPAAYALPPQTEYFPSKQLNKEPESILSMTPMTATANEPTSFPPTRSNSTSTLGSVSEPERRRNELQLRVWRARTQLPPHIPLRVFRTPAECTVEADEILARERL